MQTGVIEAEFLPWDISYAYKYQDFNKNATWIDMGAAMPILITVNTTFWNSLPEDLQTLMLEVGKEAVARNADLIRSRREEAKAGFEAPGVTFHEMPFDEKVKWSNALSDIPGAWIEEMEGKGRAGKAVMLRYLEMLESMGAPVPAQVGGGFSLT